MVELLRPEKHDLFLFRSERWAGIPARLDTLLQAAGTNTLIFAGMAASICLLLMADDAYFCGFQLLVPEDCVAARTEADKQTALEQMRRASGVDTRPSSQLVLDAAAGGLVVWC